MQRLSAAAEAGESFNGRRESRLFEGVVLVLINLRLIVALSLTGAVLGVALSLFGGHGWVAESRLSPELKQSLPSGVAGLAAEFGVDLSSAGTNRTLEFYVDLMDSDDLLGQVVQSRFALDDSAAPRPDSLTLLQIWNIQEGTPEQRVHQAIDQLRRQSTVVADRDAGLITVRVMADSGPLAVQVNRRMLERLNEFNIEQRQNQATAETRFIEDRLELASSQLRSAEDDLAGFLERNRSVTSSPELQFEQQRLQRRVDLRQSVYQSLATSYEQARIEAVRNTPVVQVITNPERSLRPRPSNLLRNLLLGFVGGMLLAFGIVFVRMYWDAQVAADGTRVVVLKSAARSAVASLTAFPGRGLERRAPE